MEKRVGMREFLIDTSKWLKEAPFFVTYRGVDRYRVEVVENKAYFLAKDEIKKVLPSKRVYGCGCEFTGETLCKKHGRI